MNMSGPVETELPPSAFRRRDKLRLSLQRTISEPDELKSRVRSIEASELAKRINSGSSKRAPFLLLDCRGYLCYADSHIRGAVHIACTDRFNRKRVQNSGSVLDLVSTNNRRNKTNGKWRWEIFVYDEGTSDLNLESNLTSPISFVLLHLLQENRQPIYLNGGIKEFSRSFGNLIDCGSRKDLNMSISPALPFAPLLTPLSPNPLLPAAPSPCNESYENEPPTQVLPFLYVGNARDAGDRDVLRKHGIRYILSVTNGYSLQKGNSVQEMPKIPTTTMEDGEPEFRTMLIPVSDNLCENLTPYFDDACDFIEEARKSGSSILIHCHAGISRSPTFAIAYIMKHINLSTLEAYAFVQKTRRIISPNLNFMGQLIEFESKLKSGNSALSDSSASSSLTSSSDSGLGLSGTVTPMIIAD